MTSKFEQDLDMELKEMFAIHRDTFDLKERNVGVGRRGRVVSKPNRPVNRERLIALLVERNEQE